MKPLLLCCTNFSTPAQHLEFVSLAQNADTRSCATLHSGKTIWERNLQGAAECVSPLPFFLFRPFFSFLFKPLFFLFFSSLSHAFLHDKHVFGKNNAEDCVCLPSSSLAAVFCRSGRTAQTSGRGKQDLGVNTRKQ